MPRRIRIFQIVHSLEPGGMENGVVNITNRLPSDEFASTVVCLEARGALAERLDPDIDVVTLQKGTGFDFRTVLKLRRLCQERRPDILHTHNLGPLVYGVAARAATFGKFRVVHGEHAQLQWESTYRSGLNIRKRMFQRKLLYAACTAIHTVSEGLADELRNLGVKRPEPVAIPNGVDCERFSPPGSKKQAKEVLGIGGDAVVIGNVGRFVRHKRHELLVEAFEELAGKHPDLHLLLVGDTGPARDQVLGRVHDSPFRDRIILSGFQQNPAPWYRAMDVMAIPSLYEGMSNVVLEAMACGVPVVAHRSCGMAEMIDDSTTGTGRLMDVADFRDLVAVLRPLVSSAAHRAAMGKTARKTMLRRYSIDRMVVRYRDLFRSVVERRPFESTSAVQEKAAPGKNGMKVD